MLSYHQHKNNQIFCSHNCSNAHKKISYTKYGFYKGIRCDSSWELAFLIYNLENGINITRNNEGFFYYFNGVRHQYFPDFIIDNIYYEIKGYMDDISKEKIKQFPYKIIVIDKSKIKFYLNYVISKYGKNFYATLYDKNKSSWLNNK